MKGVRGLEKVTGVREMGDGASGIAAMLNRFLSSGFRAFGGRRVGVVGEKDVARLRIGDAGDDIDREGFRDMGGMGGGGLFGGTGGADDRRTWF